MRKAALWMTYLYFFICPLEFIFNRWFGSSVKYIALVAAAFILMFFIVSPKQTMKFGSIQICIGAWALFEAASYLWTIHSSKTLSMLITYLMMAVLVIAVSLFPFEKKELEGILLSYTLGGLILAVLVLVIGELDEGGNSAGRITIQILGSYQDPNGLAAILLGGVFYSLHKVLQRPKGFPFFNILFSVIWAVLSIAIFYTGSRGALVAYAVALVAFVLIRSSKKSRLIILLSAPLAILIIYFILKGLLPSSLFDRLFDFESYSGGSGRTEIWMTALRKIIENPIFGFGILSHQGFFYLLRGRALAMHNTFFFILFETGIVGLTLFMVPFIKSLRCALRHKSAMLIAIIIANIASAFFLDALNLRYLWNAMMFGIIFYNCHRQQFAKNNK